MDKAREERIRNKHQCMRKHPLYDNDAFACFVCDLLEEIDELRDELRISGERQDC